MKQVLMITAAAFALAACTTGESKEQEHTAAEVSTADPQTITVRTRDYVFFEMPDSVAAGATTINLVNEGPDLHHVQLIRLEEGKTLGDLMEAMTTSHTFPPWAVEVGGPNTPVPGGTTAATLDLEAGNYVVICVIPAKDGVLHFMKGMVRTFKVYGSQKAAPLPKSDVVLTLRDYTFEFDKPIKAGKQTIRVENAAQQSHEAVLVQLAPGKTPHDVVNWIMKPEGPPPGKPIGGTTGLTQGEVNLITYDFTPGKYGLICFLPDAKDGKPHIAHGMTSEFTVAQ